MELKDIFQIIKRKFWLVILIVLISSLAIGYWSKKQKVSYETTSIVTVQGNRENTNQYQFGGYYSLQSSDLYINTILGWIKSSNIIADIYNKAGISYDYTKINQLGKNIYATKVPPQNINLAIDDQDKDKSIRIAQGTINEIKEKTAQMSLSSNSSINFEIINSELVTSTVKTNILFNILITLILSFILSIIIIFIIEYFSPTINNISKVRSIFGIEPISFKNIKIRGLTNPETKLAEKFRFLRANIIAQKNKKLSIVVSGLNEKTNTSLLCANLALSYARSGKETILVDANFSSPSLHEYFDKLNEFGFSEFLFDDNNLGKYLQKTDEKNLRIISSGIKLSYASDSIERADLEKIIEKMEKESDVVIINVPSLNSSSEAFPLFNIIKNVLLVIKTGKTNIAAANYINGHLNKKEVEKYIVVI